MATSYEDVERWKTEGKENGATHIISVCDTFDWEDYPVFVMPGEDPIKKALNYGSNNMQRINEIITL